MKKLIINNIPVFIGDNEIELSDKGMYFARYSFLIQNKNKVTRPAEIEMPFTINQESLPIIELKSGEFIKSVSARLLKYLSERVN